MKNIVVLRKILDPMLWVVVSEYGKISNIVSQIDVMCDFENFNADFTRMLFFGRITANLVFSYIANSFGRKPINLICLVLILLTNVTFLFIKSRGVYLLTCFLANMCLSLYNLVTLIAVKIMSSDMYSVLVN